MRLYKLKAFALPASANELLTGRLDHDGLEAGVAADELMEVSYGEEE